MEILCWVRNIEAENAEEAKIIAEKEADDYVRELQWGLSHWGPCEESPRTPRFTKKTK